MKEHKEILTLASIIIVGFMFLSGLASKYGDPGNDSQFLASVFKLAQAVDNVFTSETATPTPMLNDSLPIPPLNIFPNSEFNGGGDGSGAGEGRNFMGPRGDINGGGFGGGEMMPFSDQGQKEGFFGEGKDEREEFIDPREVKQTLREIRDMKRELKRFSSRVKKLANADAMKLEIDSVLSKLTAFEESIKTAQNSGTGARDTIEEFRSAELWEEVNTLRSRVELPTQIKSMQKEMKKLKKLANQRTFKNLGFDMGALNSYISETDSLITKLNELYNAGNWEDLNSEMEDLYGAAHPGEIMSVMHRMRDLYGKMRSVKDKEVKAALEETLAEVKESFNQGDFRAARETFDDYADDLERLIMGAMKIGRRGGMSEEDFDDNLQKVRDLIETKLGKGLGNNNQIQEEPFNSPMMPSGAEENFMSPEN